MKKHHILKIFKHAIYVLSFFFMFLAFQGTIPLYEKLFRFGIVFYLVVLFNLFFDKNPPTYFSIVGFFSDEYEKESNEEYLNNLVSISHCALNGMSQVRRNDLATKEKRTEFHLNIRKVEASYERICALKPPKKYAERQDEIMQDIKDFLSLYQSSDIYKNEEIRG
ncbi:hypothetical protein [Bacillus sp. NPDC094106]|uniref:hypothetical protein n=1 Tax=Bacillus sp. NPDC094106 TaxID=3363949 RepID=UPI0037F432DC